MTDKRDDMVIVNLLRMIRMNYPSNKTTQITALGTAMSIIALEQNVCKTDFMEAVSKGYDQAYTTIEPNQPSKKEIN